MLTSRMWDNLAFAAVNEFVTPISAPPVYEPQFKQVVVLVWVSLTAFVCFNAATFGHGDCQSSVKLHLFTNPDLELVNGGSDKPGGRCETAPPCFPRSLQYAKSVLFLPSVPTCSMQRACLKLTFQFSAAPVRGAPPEAPPPPDKPFRLEPRAFSFSPACYKQISKLCQKVSVRVQIGI